MTHGRYEYARKCKSINLEDYDNLLQVILETHQITHRNVSSRDDILAALRTSKMPNFTTIISDADISKAEEAVTYIQNAKKELTSMDYKDSRFKDENNELNAAGNALFAHLDFIAAGAEHCLAQVKESQRISRKHAV